MSTLAVTNRYGGAMPGVPRCEACGAGTAAWRLRGGGTLWRCPRCRHVRRDLDACPAWARDAAYGGDPGLDAVRLALTYRRLRSLLPPPGSVFESGPASKGGAVFEVGYGAGALLRRFHTAGYRVGGVDAEQLGLRVDPVLAAADLTRGALEDLPATAPGGWDLVYGVHVLEHLRDPVAGLRRAYDLLRPGGVLCLLTPTADSTGPDRLGAAWWLLEDPTHVRFFSPDSAHRMLTAAGFEQVRVRRLRLDNLSMEVASLRRLAYPRHRPAGVLAERGTVPAAVLAAPLTLAARLAVRRLSPTLELVARRPAEPRSGAGGELGARTIGP